MTETSPSGFPMAVPLENGTLVELTQEVSRSTWRDDAWPAGTQFTTEDYVGPDDAEDGIPFYIGSSRPGNSHDIQAPAQSLKVIKSKAEMEGRKIPTRSELAQAISSVLLLSADDFSIKETVVNAKDGTIDCSGETVHGLNFTFTLSIPFPHETNV